MNAINTLIRLLEGRLLRKLERYATGTESVPVQRPANRVFILVAATLVSFALLSATAQAEDGIYTETQANSGERLYSQHCAGCHGAKLEGNGSVPALSGEAFLKRCAENGQSVDDLFFIMRSFMPYNDPGKLSKQQYVEIMAYLLKHNGFKPGNKTLSSDSSVLQQIALSNKP